MKNAPELITGASDPTQRTGRRLGSLLAGYLMLVIAVITLAPFEFRVPAAFRASWIVLDERWLSDVLLNVALFLPLGFTLRRTPGLARGSATRVLLLGLGLSACIEVSQLFLAARYATFSDVVTNGLGAWIGAVLSDRAVRRIGEGTVVVSRLLLDLPLTGFVYVLVPLLWLDGLSVGHTPERLWACAPLICAGALAIAAVAESGAVVMTLAWYLVGALPALSVAPAVVVLGAVVAVTIVLVARPLWRRAAVRDRRLEPQVVRCLAPLVLAYLAMLSSYGGADLGVHGSGEMARVGILRWLEQSAGFTALGYLVAEWRGRLEEPVTRAMLAPLVVASSFFVACTRLRSASMDPVGLVVALGATTMGALLYLFQRAHIQALLGRAVDQSVGRQRST